MWDEYATWNGIELWNNNRYLSYVRKGYADGSIQADSPGGTMPLVVDIPDGWSYENPIYSSPQADNAPWYNAAYPESGDVAGFYVTSVDGMSVGGEREVAQGLQGGVAGAYRLKPKTLTVTGWLSGKNCCSVQYLYRWLCSVLKGETCFSGNVDPRYDSGFGMYDCLGGEDEESALKLFRLMGKVKVVSDPEIIEMSGRCCDDCGATNLKVQFTLLLENPRIYDPDPNLCLDEELFYGDGVDPEQQSISFSAGEDCLEDCEGEGTVVVERTYPKRRFGVKVLSDKTWCPVGGWLPYEYFDAPERGYLDPVIVEQQKIPVNIYLREDFTFALYPYERVHLDLTKVDFCKLDFQIVQARRKDTPSGTYNTLQGDTFTEIFDGEERVLKIKLFPTDALNGTWEAKGWNPAQFENIVLPFPGIKLEVDNDCGCAEGGDDCEVILHENGTWSPGFEYVGSFPPLGCKGVTLQGQHPGTYTVMEQVPLSEAFGSPSKIVLDTYKNVMSGYCQPLEWFEKCCEFDFVSGVENAQPNWLFYSGSEALHNFRVDLYKKKSVEECYCSFDRNCNRTPDFSFRVGPMIPAETTLRFDVINDSFVASTVDPLTSELKTFDASGLVSGRNGGSPSGVEFSSCYGVCAVVTAEIRRDMEDNIVSPASDAYVSLGYHKYTTAGV